MYMQTVGECVGFINENISTFHKYNINTVRIVNKNISDCFTDSESNELYNIVCKHRVHFITEIDDVKIDQNCSFYYRIKSEEIFENVKNTYEDSTIKVLDSSKKGYKAVHLYIKDPTGINLPIELQIWRTKDFTQNQQCHAIYKQKQWEKK